MFSDVTKLIRYLAPHELPPPLPVPAVPRAAHSRVRARTGCGRSGQEVTWKSTMRRATEH